MHPYRGRLPVRRCVSYAADEAGAPLLLISELAEHTVSVNARADDRARISVTAATARQADPLGSARLTLLGRLQRVEDSSPRGRALPRAPDRTARVAATDWCERKIRHRPHRQRGQCAGNETERTASPQSWAYWPAAARADGTAPRSSPHRASSYARPASLPGRGRAPPTCRSTTAA